jgi:hypothetical protein
VSEDRVLVRWRSIEYQIDKDHELAVSVSGESTEEVMVDIHVGCCKKTRPTVRCAEI